jgi:hypothetical protein
MYPYIKFLEIYLVFFGNMFLDIFNYFLIEYSYMLINVACILLHELI